MSRVTVAVAAFEAAAEEVRNAVDLAALEGVKMGRKEIAELQRRLLEGELNGSRAERRLLDILLMAVLRERMEKTIIKPAA
jgi:hypothetical protein